jgi:EmrB/QacA subfamily drug resistance transporter
MPTTLSIVTNVFVEPGERAKAIAIWTGVAGLGVAVGPLAGGFLLSHFSWSSVFAVNIPLALAALFFVKRLVPTSRNLASGPLDLPGVALSIAALSSLVYGIIEAPSRGWTSPLILGAWALAAVAGIGFVARELHTVHPMLDMSVFKNLRFSAASGSIALVFFALFGAIFVLTAYLQAVLGFTALQAGVRTLPFAVVMMVVSPLSPGLVRRLGTKLVVTIGLVVMAAGMLIAGHSTTRSGYAPIFVSMLVMAAGMALAMAPATESIMGSLPKEKAGVGSAINDTTREVGGALGVAILGSIFSTTYASGIRHHLAGSGLPSKLIHTIGESITAGSTVANQAGGITGQRLHSAVSQAFIHGMDITLVAAAGVALLGAVVAAIFLPSSATTIESAAVEEFAEPALAA